MPRIDKIHLVVQPTAVLDWEPWATERIVSGIRALPEREAAPTVLYAFVPYRDGAFRRFWSEGWLNSGSFDLDGWWYNPYDAQPPLKPIKAREMLVSRNHVLNRDIVRDLQASAANVFVGCPADYQGGEPRFTNRFAAYLSQAELVFEPRVIVVGHGAVRGFGLDEHMEALIKALHAPYVTISRRYGANTVYDPIAWRTLQ